ncbi:MULTISPECIES: peptidase C39 family protein [Streptomyces]|uniref:AraC-type arabinose-binding/dimerisation domain-containing protein n=2 Tax=Streptomyces TaxID=1883 RepID=A0A1E7M1R7_9ACTN|nr:peptidase C39 family protein [Streptomyces nanshensis]OEV22431.1 hypothetical protein AN221_01980 [Streptomyces nanshensis]
MSPRTSDVAAAAGVGVTGVGTWSREPGTVTCRASAVPPGADAPFVIISESHVSGVPTEWEPHTHPLHELVWVHGGTLVSRVADRVFTVSEGQGLWMPAGVVHGGRLTAGVAFHDAFFAPERTPVAFDGPTAIEMTPLLESLLTHLVRTDLDAAARARAESVVFDVLLPSERQLALQLPGDARIDVIAETLLEDPADPRSLWEGWTVSAEDAVASGFAPLRPPLTREGPGAGGPGAGYVRWLVAEDVAEPAYYRQSTGFTCAAVTALVARAQAGAERWESLDRAAELTFWRDATNFPACEPVGLGVAVRRRWPTATVEVFLDTDEPVLLDHLSGSEREWRAVLQQASRADARRTGVPVDGRRLSLAELREAVGRRERQVLLLVSLTTMQGFDVPHWVLCHGVVPGAVVLEDPWCNAAAGESWVDAHLLPVPDASLDAMSLLGEDRVRGAVLIGPG